MRRTIQSNKALYRDLAMESLAVIAWWEKEGMMHIVRKSSINITEGEETMPFHSVIWIQTILQQKSKGSINEGLNRQNRNKLEIPPHSYMPLPTSQVAGYIHVFPDLYM